MMLAQAPTRRAATEAAASRETGNLPYRDVKCMSPPLLARWFSVLSTSAGLSHQGPRIHPVQRFPSWERGRMLRAVPSCHIALQQTGTFSAQVNPALIGTDHRLLKEKDGSPLGQ